MSLPSFLIVGTARGGTSALARGVSNHPDVFIPAGKEMHFFDRHHEQGIDWYASLFAGSTAAAVGEATPYMYDGVAISRIATALPDVRLVAILRDPVDRAYSHFWHNVRRRRETRSFAEAVADEQEGRISSPALIYLDKGRYLHPLTAMERRHGRERMHLLANEDLRHRRAETLGSVWEFLGVDPDVGDTAEPERPLRWQIRTRLSRRRRSRFAGYPPLDPALRAELAAQLRPDVAALEKWWGRDLSAWKG